VGAIRCPVFVGRHDEARALDDALEAAFAGSGRVVALIGEAGVGKSRLAGELVSRAQTRCTVLTGRSTAGFGSSGLRAFADAFLPVFRTSPPPDSAAVRPFIAALSRLVPDWHREGQLPQTDPVVLGEGIVRLLRVLAGASAAVLVLEDLHWADPETLAVLEYLCDNIAREPVLCVVTSRDTERSQGRAVLQALIDRRCVQAIELPPLADNDALAMAKACLDCTELPGGLETLVARAEGVPFLIEELLASAVAIGGLVRRGGAWTVEPAWQHAVPLGFTESVRCRVSALGEDAGSVLQAAAMLGRTFDRPLVGPASGRPEEVVLAVLRRAQDAQLLARDTRAGEFRFRHALTRDAILADLLPHEQAALASRALGALDALRPGLPGEACETAIRLAETAGADDRVVQLLLEAASRALARGALASAEATLERARGRAERSVPGSLEAIDQMLIEALALSGKAEQVVGVADRLLAALTRPGASAARASVHLTVARALATASRWQEATEHLDIARALVGERAPHLIAAIDAASAEVAIGQFRLDDAREHAQAALERAQGLRLPDVVCHALETLGRAARAHDLATAGRLFSDAVAVAEQHGLLVRRLRALHELGTVEMLRGHELVHLEQARELAIEAGALSTAAIADLQMAATHVYNLDPQAALTCACRSADIAKSIGLGQTHAAAVALKATAHSLAGRHRAMEEAIGDALALAGGHPDIAVQVWGNARGLTYLLNEERPAALAALDQAVSFARDPRCTVPGGVIRPLWALLRTLADSGGAQAREEVRSSRAVAAPVGAGLLGFADAAAMGRAGDRTEAVGAFKTAEDLLRPYRRLAMRPLVLRLLAEAAIEDGWGDPVAWLREALGFFDQRGCGRIAAACRTLLARAGATVPRRGRGSSLVPPALRARGVTSREVDVLVLVIEGLTNKQIAQRLYLSPKTVEKHIEHLMDKTGARSRAQLSGAAAAAGLESTR
jgi:DNA-binding CsgD family transcriptional regulator